MRSKFILKFLVTFFIFLLLVIFITYPLVFHMGDMVTGFGDELVIAWIQNWVIHSLFTNPLGMFNANIYYPFHNTLAYSDLLLTSSIFSIIPLKLIGEPIAAFNFTFISSLSLLGFSVFVLSYYLTKDYFASLLSGILVIFSPVVLDKKVHLQILALQWVPFAILCLLLFAKKKKTRYLVLTMSFFLLQTYNSFMAGYFIAMFYLVYVVTLWFSDRSLLRSLITKKNLTIIVISILILLPAVIPYFQVSYQLHAVRDIRDTIHFAIQPEDLIYPNDHTRLQGVLQFISSLGKYPANAEIKPGYLGFVFSLLSLFVLIYSIKYFKKSAFINKVLFSTGILGLVLSLGPLLHFNRVTIHHPFPIPLPYMLFYYIFPGFQGFRNSSRWEMLFVLCFAVLIAVVLSRLVKKYSNTRKAIIYSILIIGVVAEYNFPMKFFPIIQKENFPKVYEWLNTTPKDTSAIIMPASNWNMKYSSDEMMREYYSTVNFRKTVNGYSGFSPTSWQNLLYALEKDFPKGTTVSLVRETGVRYILVDKDSYDRNYRDKLVKNDGAAVVSLLRKNPSVKFVKQIQNYYVFEFIHPTTPSSNFNH